MDGGREGRWEQENGKRTMGKRKEEGRGEDRWLEWNEKKMWDSEKRQEKERIDRKMTGQEGQGERGREEDG